MRILHMIPDIGISNGIMSVILNYAKAMPDDIKFDVVYFAESKENKQAEIETLGGRVFKINPPSPKTALKGEMDQFFATHKGEWEALHINAPHFAVFIAPAARRAGIKKICLHCHSSLFSLKPENLKRNELFYKLGKRFADKRFACSKVAGEYWYGKDYTVLNNAIDCDKYKYNKEISREVARNLHIENKLIIGHIGRTDVAQKNHPFLFEIFAEVKHAVPESVLLLIGGIPTADTDRMCEKLRIKKSVLYLGMRDDVNELLQAIDVLVFPSKKEGLPVSVVEAQAAGVPVIISDSVTDEVIITKETFRKSLNESALEWARKAIEISKIEKRVNVEQMKAAGWDVYSNAKTLIDYYRG